VQVISHDGAGCAACATVALLLLLRAALLQETCSAVETG
jgi:hypothetical protein